MSVILFCIFIEYASAAQFFEGYLPHNAAIPSHNQCCADPKMSPIAPPNVPKRDAADPSEFGVEHPFAVRVKSVWWYYSEF